MTIESRTADMHQRREKSLKNLRECAMRVTKGNNIAQCDTLLRDQVSSIVYMARLIHNFKKVCNSSLIHRLSYS